MMLVCKSLYMHLGSQMSWIFIAIIAIIFLVLLFVIYLRLPNRINCDFFRKHVFITGGSKGIGKAVAVEALKQGCGCLTIVARNLKDLVQAAEELAAICQIDQIVQYFQIDVSENYKNIKTVIRTAESGAASVCKGDGGIDIIINNAGTVVQGGFDDLDTNAFESQIKTNFLSLVYVTRAVIRRMKERRSGHIAFVSSASGQCSLWGYSAYSPSKFAIRGFADALHMELLPFNIGVTILYPPNTSTEGFQEELKTMTDEIRFISDAGGLFSPSQVASSLVQGMVEGKYAVSVGLEGWMLKTLSAGAAPEPDFKSAVAQFFFGGILRGVMLIYLGSFNNIVYRCHKTKQRSYK